MSEKTQFSILLGPWVDPSCLKNTMFIDNVHYWKRVRVGVTNFDCQGQGLEVWKSKSARVEAPRVRGKKHNSGGKEQSQLSHSHFVDILRNTSAGHQREM